MITHRKLPMILATCVIGFFFTIVDADEVDVKCDPISSVVFCGDEIKFALRLRTEGKESALEMNHLGMPSPLIITIKDNEDREVQARRSSADIGGTWELEERFFRIGNENLEFVFDINETHSLLNSGTYSVTASWYGKVIKRWHVEVLNPSVESTFDINGPVADQRRFPHFYPQGGPNLSCRLEALKGKDADKQTITLFKVTYSLGEKIDLTPSVLRLYEERDARIVDVYLDYRWQLWMLLRCADEHSLVVCDLKRGRHHYAFSWDKKPIEAQAYRAFKGFPDSRFVIAGRSGRGVVTTSTVEYQDGTLNSPLK